MTIRDIFVPLLPEIGCDAQFDAALQLARRLDVHVDVTLIRPDPMVVATSVPDMLVASGIVVQALEREGMATSTAAQAKFEKWQATLALAPSAAGRAGQTAEAAWHQRIGSLEAAIVEFGRVSDLIVINRPDPHDAVLERAFSVAVFETGRPVILVPKEVGPNLLDHIVVAWNGGLEAARAVAGAMPLLRRADRVSLFTASSNGELLPTRDLVEHLGRHGVQVEHLSADSGAEKVGLALLDIAEANRASLIVMGAYSHSRLRETLLGGVTRHIIHHAAIPVLMMH